MKKLTTFLLCLMLIVSLSACGSNSDSGNASTNDAGSTTQASTENEQSSEQTEQTASSESNTQTEQETTSESTEQTSTDDTDWKQFLQDYEAWVDSYIAILDKYEANPTDASILSDYTKLTAEMTEWADKADKIQIELEDSPEALQEYTTTLSRIATKLSEVAK